MMLPVAVAQKLTSGTLVISGEFTGVNLREDMLIDWVEDGENPITLEDTPEFIYDGHIVYVIMKFYWEGDHIESCAREMVSEIKNRFDFEFDWIFTA